MKIAVVGATGLVGRTFVRILDEDGLHVDRLSLFSGEKSAGEIMSFRGQDILVRGLDGSSFDSGYDVCLFAAGADVSREYVPMAVAKGSVVIDNSAEYRSDPDVPLVVPEVNAHALGRHKGIIANPNCCAAPLTVALWPLMVTFGLDRVVVSTYQSVSGAGLMGLADMESGCANHFPYPIRDNLIPHIDDFGDNGYTGEEIKIMAETRKILENPGLKITVTAVRVPISYCHSQSVNVKFQKECSIDDVRNALSTADGIKVVDRPVHLMYPMPLFSAGQDLVLVGRLRTDTSCPNCVNMWIVADNIRKGAATNALQILKLL